MLDEEGVLQLWEWAESEYTWVLLGKCSLIPKPEQLSYFTFDSVGRYKYKDLLPHIIFFCFIVIRIGLISTIICIHEKFPLNVFFRRNCIISFYNISL